jgi:1,4-dihydroxy-2-naphthoyl-CoA hydrolase
VAAVSRLPSSCAREKGRQWPVIDANIMPFAKLMGVTIIEARAEGVIAELLVREDLCTTNSILHGGAVMAFADSVGAVATFLNLPPGANTTTIESKTNFVAALRAGETARAECSPVHIGRTTMVWQTRILRPNGKLCAIVTQTQMILNPQS